MGRGQHRLWLRGAGGRRPGCGESDEEQDSLQLLGHRRSLEATASSWLPWGGAGPPGITEWSSGWSDPRPAATSPGPDGQLAPASLKVGLVSLATTVSPGGPLCLSPVGRRSTQGWSQHSDRPVVRGGGLVTCICSTSLTTTGRWQAQDDGGHCEGHLGRSQTGCPGPQGHSPQGQVTVQPLRAPPMALAGTGRLHPEQG